MDVDTRLLRVFAAVAEEGGVSAAARRLFVSQPALTKQIAQLERLLDTRLFVRTHAGMSLTDAGRELARRLPDLLEQWDDAAREAIRAGHRATSVLRVGFVTVAANEATRPIVAEFQRRRPGWRVDLRRSDWSDPTAGLAAGIVDAAFLRVPVPGQERFGCRELLTEPRWVALPAAHPLAAQQVVAFRDLWDQPFVTGPPEAGVAREHWLAARERSGRDSVLGATVRNSDEWLAAIAEGAGVALVPEGVTRFYIRPDIVYRPVTGVSPSRVVVAWSHRDDRDPVIADFVESCAVGMLSTR